MQRELLRQMLDEGMSLEQIGRRVGRHPSTLGYWLRRHGMDAVNAKPTAPKGALDEQILRELVDRGLSVRQLAVETERSYSTVRYWLNRYGLSSRPCGRIALMRAARAAGRREVELTCAQHGRTRFVLGGRDYYRCAACRAERVAGRRRQIKKALLKEAGGRCALCGYDRVPSALHFHHLDPTQKAFGLSGNGEARSIARARVEAAKCVLLCANCHAEVEAGAPTVF